MRRAVLLSLGLHGLLLALLVAGAWLWPGRGMKGPPVLAEVELVEQNTPAVGRAASVATATATATAANPSRSEPKPVPKQALPTRAPPNRAPLPLPPPAAPARPAAAARVPPAPSSRQGAAAVRLGHTGSIGTGLVSGRQVIPAALDKAVQNVPPGYPRRAVRRGEQGSVILRVHVAADGSAAAVDIFRTSGYTLLDSAARRAVARWHFVPANRAGFPVPSTMLVKIRFVLTNPEGSR